MAAQQPGDALANKPPVLVVNNRQANVFDYGNPTRFSGGPKRPSFRDPLDPRNGYNFGKRRILNQNPNAAIFTSGNDSRTIQNRSYGNAISVYDKPTSNELNVKEITTKTEVINNAAIQTKSKVLNDVFFLNYQKRRENNNIVKQPIALIPEKKNQTESFGKRNIFGYCDPAQLTYEEFKQKYEKIPEVYGMPLLAPKGKIVNLSINDVKNTQSKLKSEGRNPKLTTDLKYSSFVDLENTPAVEIVAPLGSASGTEILDKDVFIKQLDDYAGFDKDAQDSVDKLFDKDVDKQILGDILKKAKKDKLEDLDIDILMQIIIEFETDFKLDDNLNATISEKSKKKLENKASHVLYRQVKQIYAVVQEKLKNSPKDQQELYKQLNAHFKESAKANKEFNKFDGPRNAEIASLEQSIDDVQKEIVQLTNDGADQSEIDKKNAEKVVLETKKKQLEDAGTKDYKKKSDRETKEADELKDIQDKLKASKDIIAAEEKVKLDKQTAEKVREDTFTNNKTTFSQKENVKTFINLLLKDAGYSQDEIDYAQKKIYEGTASSYGNLKKELHAGDPKNKSKTYADYKKEFSDYLTSNYSKESIQKAIADEKNTAETAKQVAAAKEKEIKDQQEAAQKQIDQEKYLLTQQHADASAKVDVVLGEISKTTVPAEERYALSAQLLNEITQDSLIELLSESIATGDKQNADKADKLYRLLILNEFKKTVKDDKELSKFYQVVLTRDKLGKSFHYVKDKSLYSSLSGNKLESVRTKITEDVDKGFLQTKIDVELKLLKQAVAPQ